MAYFLSEQAQKSFFSRRIEELYDEFTRKIFEDYYLILKDGRIVGSRPATDTDVSLAIKFEVVGVYCDSASDRGWSPSFSPRGLDYDLYMNTKELSIIMDLVPNQEHLIVAEPMFMSENKKSSKDEVVGFRKTEKTEGMNKHLLFIYAPHLIRLFYESSVHERKAKSFRLRNYKYEKCRILKEEYDYPADIKDKEYSYGIGGWMNFFEIVDRTHYRLLPLGDWKSLLMCENCGKFYLSKKGSNFKYETGVSCPVCMENDPEIAKHSVMISDGPWFRSFISEYP